MLTKTRTAIITLVAAGSFATATVVPSVSQALDNGPSGTWAAECEIARLTEGLWNEAAASDAAHGQWALVAYDIDQAEGAKANQVVKGCPNGPPAAEIHGKTNRPPVAGVKASTPPVTTKAPVAVKAVTLAETAIG
jgi:hypothetical protein